jgi:hypothetical protein
MTDFIKETTIVFTDADINDLSRVKSILSEINKNDLLSFVKPLVSMMRLNGWRCEDTKTNGEMSSLFTILAKKSYSASAYVCKDALAFIFASKRNINVMLDHFPNIIKSFVKYLLKENNVKLVDLPQEFDGLIIKSYKRSRTDYEISDTYKDYDNFFRISANSYFSLTDNTSVSLNPALYPLLMQLFINSDEYKIAPPTAEPPTTQYTFNAEHSLRNEWMQMKWLVNNNKIKVYDRTAQFIMKNTYLPVFIKNANTAEFYTKKGLDLVVRRIRSKMLLNIFAELISNGEPEYEGNLIKTVRTILEYEDMHKMLLLPQFSARTLSYLNLRELSLSLFDFILNNCVKKGWYDVNDIMDKIPLNPEFCIDIQGIKHSVNYCYYLDNLWSGERVFDTNVIDRLVRPLFDGLIFMLASAGLAEIAYDDVEKFMPSYFSGLCAFRLTSLCRYELGLDNDYVKSRGKEDYGIELEENILIIKVKNDDVPGIGFIRSISTPATEFRYRVTVKTFLKGCKNAQEAISNVDTFLNLAKDGIPQIWIDFLDDIRRKCVPMKLLNSNDYFIYEVPGDNKELLKIFVTDSTLLRICHRATGNLVLVKNEDIAKFKVALANYGYSL